MVASGSGESSTALTQPGQGGLGLVELEQDPAQAVQVGGVLGFDLAGFFDVGAGLGEVFAAVGPHEAEVVEGFGVVRLHVNALLQVVLGPLGTGGRARRRRRFGNRIDGRAGRELLERARSSAAVKLAHRFVEILELEVDQRADNNRASKLSGKRRRALVEDLQGGVAAALIGQDQGQTVVGLFQARRRTEGILKIGGRLGQPALRVGQMMPR